MLPGRENEPGRPIRGLTLVEVVAALVILGVLLALIVKASTQSSRQLALAEQRLNAAKEAERIISEWFASGAAIEPGLSGQIPGIPPLYWETVERKGAHLQHLGARVVQLRMFAAPNGATPGVKPDVKNAEPVITVDLLASVLPLPELPAEVQQAAATRPSDRDDREDPRLSQPPPFVLRQ